MHRRSTEKSDAYSVLHDRNQGVLQMTIEDDLSADLNTYLDNKSKPIFHRLKFAKVSFYLTKSTFHDLAVSHNAHGHYRIFSWDDWRSKDLLGLELGEDNPIHGPVKLIGRYTPAGNDLRNCQYHSPEGRKFYESARFTVDGIRPSESEEPTEWGEDWSDPRMGEIIPTGIQGKAIYGEGDYIIDGAAGTGKSTTAIQKIKLLTKNAGVDPRTIVVLVHSEELKYEFMRLLVSLEIDSVRVTLIGDFFDALPYGSGAEHQTELGRVWTLSEEISEAFQIVAQEVDSLENSVSGKVPLDLSKAYESLKEDQESARLIKQYGQSRARFFSYYRQKRDEWRVKKEDMEREVTLLHKKLVQEKWKRRMRNRNGPLPPIPAPEKIEESLSFSERGAVYEAVSKHRTRKVNDLKAWQKNISSTLRKKYDGLKGIVANLRLRLVSEDFAQSYFPDRRLAFLLCRHIQRFLKTTDTFHTIVLDEAQKSSQAAIHLLWLNCRNLVLTGDEMQSDNKYGIGGWNNLGLVQDSFKPDARLNIFVLKNNFRQTFELGALSHGFRELALDRPITDISDEYFDNQKGFPKPEIAKIRSDVRLEALVKRKIQLARKSFARQTPVVVFYQDGVALDQISRGFESSRIPFGLDGDESESVMLVSISKISGRSFPVVIAPLLEEMSDQELYILLSRARFDLTLYVRGGQNINSKILALKKEGLIQHFAFR